MQLPNLLKKLLPKPPALLGITLDQQCIRLTELSKVRGDFSLRSCKQIPLPPADTAHFSFTHPELPSLLKQAIQEIGATTHRVALALPHSSVLFKTIELDKALRDKEIAIQVRAHAEKHFKYPISELMLDFEILGRSKNHLDLIEVRWVAARRAEVDAQVNALALAGLQVIAVEVDLFSLSRLASYYITKHAMQSSSVAVIHVHDAYALCIVLHEHYCIYTRVEHYVSYTDSDLSARVISAIQLFLSSQSDPSNLSAILLAGHPASSDLLEKIQTQFDIKAQHLDIFSLLGSRTSHAPHQFAISAGLAMRVGL